jgi:hypothetical protein
MGVFLHGADCEISGVLICGNVGPSLRRAAEETVAFDWLELISSN